MTNSTMRAPATSPSPVTGEATSLSHRQILTILSGLVLGMFLAALDQNIVSVAIVRISTVWTGFDEQAWATNGLPDHRRRSPRRCTANWPYLRSKAVLSHRDRLFRSRLGRLHVRHLDVRTRRFPRVQGLGAGGLMSLAFTIVGDIAPARERVRYQGYFMMVFGVATVLGPVLGGFFSDYDYLGGIGGLALGCSWSMCRSALSHWWWWPRC